MKNSHSAAKRTVKFYLDFIPFVILLIIAINFLREASAIGFSPGWRHYLGLSAPLIVGTLFYKNHQLGVISLGATFLLALLGFMSFTTYFTTTSFGFGALPSVMITIPGFQPIFFLWIVIHFIVSHRYYFGVLSKNYWLELRKNKAKS